MPHSRHRSHKHHHSAGRVSSAIQYLLLFWSLLTLVTLLFFMRSLETAPLWKIVAFAGSAVAGLVFCIMFLTRAKK